MTKFSFRAYESGFAAEVAALMASERRARRARCPLLPAGLDDEGAAAKLLAGAGEGVLALDDEGRPRGFLFAERIEDPTWGSRIEVHADRWAFPYLREGGEDASPPGAAVAALARLYARGFARVSKGELEHRVHCTANDRASLEAWFRLGFGMEQAYAAARLDRLAAGIDAEVSRTVPGLEIRAARPGDEDALESLSPIIALAQAAAPTWAGAPPEYLAGLREGFRGLVAEEGAIVLLAFREGRAVGYQAWFPASADPVDGAAEGAVELAVGGTVLEERGRGIGLALTARGIAAARERGYRSCFIDWRTTNPLSSSFWPARGFEPHLYRLSRRLDPLSARA